jgi:hypothetical protein
MTGEELIGKKVRMTEAFKKLLTGERRFSDSPDHVEEFGHCVGTVECLVDYGEFQGPEVDVRWPSGFRYAYPPDGLEVVEVVE